MMNEPPKYAYPYPAQGYYQGPPVMAPPPYQYQYVPPPPRRSEPGFLEGCAVLLLYVAAVSLMSVAATHQYSSSSAN
ncbi:cysteine-rich and transmembrane domain-containing protein WIH2-like [Impatiens glandulifera]|uniref:cysteine-rich and transmembrane domain-containing protein WIH2-like n=1 Tax=Impatiens glandulifera TaxID=253017 RepID=UPI001FB1815E|nr:cysteine-rich and transmembrane domain-containing protein WIH2-like [Impatiens glandulifera]